MSKQTLGNTEASVSDSEHSSSNLRISAVGIESLGRIGPNVHPQRPLADAANIAGDQPIGYLGPTSQLGYHKSRPGRRVKISY